MESRTCRGIIVHVLSRLPGVGLVDQNGDAIHNNYIICLLFALMYYIIAKYIWICMWITAWTISWTALWREILLLCATEISFKKTKYLMFTTMWSLHLQKRPSQSLSYWNKSAKVAMQMCNIHLFWHWLWSQLNNALFVDCNFQLSKNMCNIHIWPLPFITYIKNNKINLYLCIKNMLWQLEYVGFASLTTHPMIQSLIKNFNQLECSKRSDMTITPCTSIYQLWRC